MPRSRYWPIYGGIWAWRRLGYAASTARFDKPAIMATVLGSLFLAGATIGALSLVLPHPSEHDSSALWS